VARFPGAIFKEVTRHRTLMSRHRGICKHIAVSEAASLFNYFNQPGNPTSHFYVRYDGDVEQYVDTRYRAPANLEGNPSLISIETQGGVQSGQIWTPAQLETLAQIDAWTHAVHGVPLQLMPNSRPEHEGICFHRQGVDPYRVSGGELWSSAYGKTCPEPQRIAQIPHIITRATAIAAGEDMDLTPQNLTDIANAVWNRAIGSDPASTIMVRLNPGPAGIAAAVAAESAARVWNYMTKSAVDASDQSALTLLRWAHLAALQDTVPEDVLAQLDAIQTTQGEEDAQTDRIETAIADLGNVQNLAAAIAAAMPPSNPVDQAALEAALRTVLGSVDE
jgi:hypothetical protein